MANFDFIQFKLPAKPEYVGVIRLTLSGIANRMGFTYETIEDLKIAVSEATTNVVSHAYENEHSGELNIGFAVHSDRLEVMVSDQGTGFDLQDVRERIGPVRKKEDSQSVSELREGGFGLFLINTLMDEVQINNDYGVMVLMTKYLDEAEVDLNDSIPTK